MNTFARHRIAEASPSCAYTKPHQVTRPQSGAPTENRPRMKAIALSPTLEVSRLIYGWWRLMSWNMSAADIVARIEACLALGISTHDHADIYGAYQVEPSFGAALKTAPALRDKIQLISKCGIKLVSDARPQHARKAYDTSANHIMLSVETSLKNLHTDYLDVLLIHRPDPLMNADEIAHAFYRLRKSGKVREFGVSNFTASQFALLQSRVDFPLVSNQLEISVLQHQAFFDGSLDQAQQLRRSPMAWSPLAGGKIFTEDSERANRLRACLSRLAKQNHAETDQLAFAWLLHHPAQILPVIGSQSLERITLAAKSAHIALSDNDWYDIWEAGGSHLP